MTANGGNGGNVAAVEHGPGGGGGGGRILFQAALQTCTTSVNSGVGGTESGGSRYGAGPSSPTAPGNVGTRETPSGGFSVPAAPQVVTPPDGAQLNVATPTYTGTAPAGALVHVFVDGAEIGQVPANGAGNWSFAGGPALAQGTHSVDAQSEVQAVWSPKSVAHTFTIDLLPPPAPVILTPASGSSVNTTTPVLSGTAEPNATIDVVVDGTLVGTVTADSGGAWSYTLTSGQALTNGVHTVSATATDGAGNTGPTASQSFTVDTVPPAVAISAPAAGATVGTSRPTISGTAEAGATVDVSVDGVLVGTITATGGTWTYTLTSSQALSDGTHTASVTATDGAGNASAPVTRTFSTDTTPPAVAITAPAVGATLGTSTPTISGTAEAGATVTILVDGVGVGSVTATGGSWTYTLTSDQALFDGAHTASVTATDAVGNVSAPVTRTFNTDTTPPAVAITSPAAGATLGTDRPTISGTAEAGATVEISVDGTNVGTATASVTGTWTYTLTAGQALPDGNHTVSVTATDGSGNVSAPVTRTFHTDTTPPAVAITSPADGAALGTATPTISGTAEAGATVQLAIDGSNVATVTASVTGTWTYTLTTGQALADGAHTASVTASDTTGNTSAPVTRAFSTDTTAPVVAITAPAAGATLGTATPTISGTAEAGATVDISVDGSTAGSVTAAGGTWSYTLTSGQALADGAHTVSVVAIDGAGNSSAPVSRSFNIDTTPPPVAITAPNSGGLIATATPTISGTAEADATVEVSVDGVVVGTVTATGGVWSYTLTQAQALADGAHTAEAVATDAIGNASAPVSTPFKIDTTPPAVAVTSPVENATLAYATPVVAGTAEPGATVEVTVDGVVVATVTADTNGDWSYTLDTAQALMDGAHTASVVATDAAGNPSAPVTRHFMTDVQAPAAPVIASPAENSAVNTGTPTISGTTEPNATVEITVDGVVVGTVTADGSGAWSYTLTPGQTLGDGPHTASAVATDGAGNTGLPGNTSFTVDTVPPVAPVIVTPADGATIATAMPVVSGTAEAGSSVEVFIDSVSIGTVTASMTGTWSITAPASLFEGPHTADAISRDAAQNATPSATVTFTVDLTAPGAPIVVAPADGSATHNPTPAVTGTADPDVTVDVYVDGVLVGTVTADSTGSWTLPATGSLSEGSHTVSATARDAANNATAGPANTFEVDLTAPPAPAVTDPADGDQVNTSSPTVTGTGEPGATVNVYVDGTLVGTAQVDMNGNWSLPLPMQSDGDHTITVEAVDPAGNVGPETSIDVTIDTVPPAAPVVLTPAEMATETTPTPTVSGTAEPGATVEITVDGVVVGTVTADTNGDWSYTLTPDQALGEGNHTVSATATDEAGNTGPASQEIDFTITLTTDGGMGDGGMGDGGIGDGGMGDGGMGDGGTVDGGMTDGGMNADGGTSADGGVVTDGGDEGSLSYRGGGCGCAAGTSADPALLYLVAGGLGAFVMRRRRIR
ncbi:MAG: adhesin [Myxococcaceae bacterium]|nr:adhesin [Myxococcaceae bacterium]